MILLYNIVWIMLFPLVIVLMIFRIIIGKEDSVRITERLGVASATRSIKSVIWINAVSVGEAKLALTLASYLNKVYPKYRVLITTGTKTSAAIVRHYTSSSIIHQYSPIDNFISVWLFLRYWKPQIGIFIEGELWPNIVYSGAKYCPLILVNARISNKSFVKWGYFKPIIQKIASKFKIILCQSDLDTEKYHKLGINSAIKIGNLKYSSDKLDANVNHIKSLKLLLKNRQIFLAASTHPGDEAKIVALHKKLKTKHTNLITIIAPRHVNRSQEIQNLIANNNLAFKVRSKKESITDTTDIYLADTMGELGVLFSVSDVSFIGGSFAHGGHNPIEPAYFNTHILFGPNMSNFAEIAKEFLENDAAIQVQDVNELESVVDNIFSSNISVSSKSINKIIRNHMHILDTYISYIKQYIE